MGMVLSALRSLKLWQVGLLAAVLAGGTGISVGAYLLLAASGETKLGEDQQLIPIRRDNLVNEVSVSGSLVYTDRQVLTFGSRGTVEELLVEEGQRVEEGQSLARLDAETIANLEETVAQARVNLQKAAEALALAKDPHTPLEMAQAEASVASSQLVLLDAQDALDRLKEPTAQDLARAESAVANAHLALNDAQEALDALLTPGAQDITQAGAAVVTAQVVVEVAQEALDLLLEPSAQDLARAESRVTDARLAVDKASKDLEALVAGASAKEIAESQSQIGFAATSLDNAGRDLKLAEKEWDDKALAAADLVAASVEDYRAVFRRWLGAEIEPEETHIGPTDLLESWGTDLASLYDPQSRFYDLGRAWLAQGSRDDPATRWNETVVYAWLNFYPGAFSATCEDTSVAGQDFCVDREIDDAWNALSGARDSLDTTETQEAKAVANAETAVNRAEESLATTVEALADLVADPDALDIERLTSDWALAQADMEEAESDLVALIAGPSAIELAVKEKQVSLAIANFDLAEADLAALTGEPDPLQLEASRARVALAQADLDQAKADLADITGGPSPLDLDAKQSQVAVAQAGVAQAEDDLAELRGSSDPLEVDLREVQVASAKAALAAAVQHLDSASLKAPWDGIVSVVNVEAGQEVAANSPVVEMVNPASVEVDGFVDEIDVLFISEGAPARVTMDALPGEVLEGSVSSISAAARNQQGVVSYPIRIRVESQGASLPEGLSAVASVVIREELNVLLVPIQALYGTFDQPVVRVMRDGRIQDQPVVLGNADDFWVVVEQGLAEADQVVMQSQQATTGGFGFGGFGGTFRRFSSASLEQRSGPQRGPGGTSRAGGAGGGRGR